MEITWTVSLACLLETLTAAGVSCRGGQSCKENYITTMIALSLCPHSLYSVMLQMWPALGVQAGICAGSVALEFQADTTVSEYPPS